MAGWRSACNWLKCERRAHPSRNLPIAVQPRLHLSRRPFHRRLPGYTRHHRLLRLVVPEGRSRQPARLRRRRSDRLNPDLGTDADYWTWIDALRARGMGHVLDLVPNHMGIASSATRGGRMCSKTDRAPLRALLRHRMAAGQGRAGEQGADSDARRSVRAVLERQELQVAYRDGAFAVDYGTDATSRSRRTPTRPSWVSTWRALKGRASSAEADELQSIITAASEPAAADDATTPRRSPTRAREKEIVKRRLAALVASSGTVRDYIGGMVARFNGTPGQPRSFDLLDRLLNEQSYRLAHWRVASEEINYRRFFDVNQLAALRMEDPAVFDEMHRFVFELILRGERVRAAGGPCRWPVRAGRLPLPPQKRAAEATEGREPPADRHRPDPLPFYIIVEKILGRRAAARRMADPRHHRLRVHDRGQRSLRGRATSGR